ncbi:MAG: hypothetical protein JW885_02560 [Deltaproteobacteria bacterium]|nr:hypothetical protein [Candidatus Zymogenaceae bacterium]
MKKIFKHFMEVKMKRKKYTIILMKKVNRHCMAPILVEDDLFSSPSQAGLMARNMLDELCPDGFFLVMDEHNKPVEFFEEAA